jgi:Ca2+-binding RTX toxin-like protein
VQTIIRRAVAATLGVLFIAIAVPASAGTIGISNSTLIFGADLGEQIAISASTTPTDLLLSGATFDILTPGCFANGADSVTCALSGFTNVIIIGSALDDVVTLSGVTIALDFFVTTKDGDDILIGGAGNDILKGGNGDDILIAGPLPGHDHLFGGPGNNVIIGPSFGGIDEPPDPEPLLRPVPEPTTLILLGLGLGASSLRARRQSGRRTSS